ncbi:alpha/beta hydrolase [Nocardia goodfellowii]|uniref:Pimeloyl-ACP methyl ester carboxylesterase n=1 Tax=Nocardia goodfellowii TaxID=882446 RepID=A0ABS4QLY2_9NOCA|nr:alpha/beta hydrolase [Nocardia goodfellowii]MBP2192155.1 pimeloyl-ACP methyl ester carboxylesterase [Nocardia goodfellowii]
MFRSRRKRAAATMAVASTMIVALGACGSGSTPPGARSPEPEPSIELQRFYDQTLNFESCERYATTSADRDTFTRDPNFQCARTQVPLDYDDPEGKTASVALLKTPARGKPIGSLVLNPGGPGGAGMGMAALAAGSLSKSPVTENFDLVGFDPRGVAASTPAIDCFSDAEIDAGQGSTTVLTGSGSWTETETRTIVERCSQRSGGDDILAGVGTRNVARDMDILRAVLGDDQLTFLGRSYGTRLGAVYAEMFPAKVRAMVLDGGIDPHLGTAERRVTQFRQFQRAFDDMAVACASTPDCALGTDPSRAVEVFHGIARPLIDKPIVTANGRRMDFDAAYGAVTAGLFDSRVWPIITKGIGELRDGSPETLLRISDVFSGRGPDGVHPNFSEANFAIKCMDEQRNTPEEEAELKRRVQEVAPFTDAGLGTEGARDACESWPAAPGLDYPYATGISGLSDTLTISITGDPTTPYDGGVRLADTLGGSLLTVDGQQHTIAVDGTNKCVDDIVADYLVNLKSPAEQARCSL